METHASSIPLDLKLASSHRTVTIDIIPTDNKGTLTSSSPQESRQESSSDLETNFSSFSWRANPSSKVIHRAARFIYNSAFNIDFENCEQQNQSNEKENVIAYSSSEFRNSMIDDLRPLTVYEYAEINSKVPGSRLKYNILDYYERYSPSTAKTLIDTLFLSRKEICKQCARFEDSPVYSDRLIYAKRILYAREVVMFQFGDSINFISRQSHDSHLCDYMPVCNLTKTNASGIFYLSGLQDVFDLRSSLEPEIILINSEFSGIINTQMYHRRGSKSCSRISQNLSPPMRFQPTQNSLTNLKSFGFNADLNNWINFPHQVKLRSSRENEHSIAESQPNRASLLLLEPLLLMPSFSQGKRNLSKSRISHIDKLGLVKIVIAYTLAFFIVTIITFYLMYFT